MSINVIDLSETAYGVRVGARMWFVDEHTKPFFDNYEPVDQDSPDYEGTEDAPDITDPREQDLEGDAY